MKLVELLAKEMNKWPEDCTCGYCMQADESTQVFFGGAARSIFLSELADDRETAKVTIAQWQAERDRQKGGEWKRHRGGRKQPIEDGVKIEVRWRNGEVYETSSQLVDWVHYGASADIMAFRVISQTQAEEVEYRGTFPCAPAGEPATTIEYDIEFPSGVFTLEAKTDQIDGPIKWRDTVNELDAYIEEFTREREALINRLALEGFALIPAMTPVMGVADIDFSDWRNWEAGDVMECVSDHGWCGISVGSKYTLTKDSFFSFADDYGDVRTFSEEEFIDEPVDENFKFIRRP